MFNFFIWEVKLTLRELLKKNRERNYDFNSRACLKKARRINRDKILRLIRKYGWDFEIVEKIGYANKKALNNLKINTTGKGGGNRKKLFILPVRKEKNYDLGYRKTSKK
jgi:hypothetical protein